MRWRPSHSSAGSAGKVAPGFHWSARTVFSAESRVGALHRSGTEAQKDS